MLVSCRRVALRNCANWALPSLKYLQWQKFADRRVSHYSVVRRVNVGCPTSTTANKNDAPKRLQQPRAWTEADYEKILCLPIKPRPYSPSPWVHALDPSSCLKLLPATLRGDPLLVVRNGSGPPPSLGLVGQCLEAYVVSQHSKLGSREEAQQIFKESKAGARALDWFLASSVDHVDLALHPRFIQTLVHLMRAEDTTVHLWKWLFIDHVPSMLKNDTPKAQQTWKSMLHRHLVESEVYWAEGHSPMTAGLDAYLRAYGIPPTKRGSWPVFNAGKWLVRQLYGADNSQISAALFERFVKSLRLSLEVDFYWAKLNLSHPTRPSAAYSLKSLRSYANGHTGSRALQDMLDPKDNVTRFVLFWWLVKTAQVLHTDGDVKAAYWVMDLGRAKVPDLFRDPKFKNGGDTRGPTHATQQPVDQNGISLETPRMRKIRLAVGALGQQNV